jgi:hypothetical protein
MSAFPSPLDSGHMPHDHHQSDELGQAVVALVQRAAELSLEDAQRAITAAHDHAMRLRAAEDRIRQLDEEVKQLESRAVRAESWLETIKKEVKEKLIGANRSISP